MVNGVTPGSSNGYYPSYPDVQPQNPAKAKYIDPSKGEHLEGGVSFSRDENGNVVEDPDTEQTQADGTTHGDGKTNGDGKAQFVKASDVKNPKDETFVSLGGNGHAAQQSDATPGKDSKSFTVHDLVPQHGIRA